MKINLNQAKEFLEGINGKDNVIIFTHKDLDGFASGILFLDYCKKKGSKVDVKIINYGESRMFDVNLDSYNKILIADLAPSAVSEDLFKLEDKEILYTDHHQEEEKFPIPEFVLELRTISEGYIPSSRTCYEICGGKKWVSVLGTLSDMGQLHKINSEFLEEFYSENKVSYEEMFEYVKKVNNTIVFFSASMESFYKIAELESLQDIVKLEEYYMPVEKEFERLEKEFNINKEDFNNIVYFFMESKYSLIKSPFTTATSFKEKEKICVFCTPQKENIISISGRNQSRKYDVCKILQDCVSGLKEGKAGGHKVAAGGQVDKSDLEKFKERLKEINVGEYKI
jgi:single-stranded DNA-specific DHH superfamily exonuclease